MTFVEFEHRVLPRIILPLMAGLALLAVAGRNQAQAAGRNSFVISDNEGYGITECLTNGTACGRVVADAWCEAHGFGQSVAFGRADDVTGTVKAEPQDDKAKLQPIANQVKPGSVVVTCDE